MQAIRRGAMLAAMTLSIAACGAEVLVVAERSDDPSTATTSPPFQPDVPSTEDPPVTTTETGTVPPTDPATTPPPTAPRVIDREAINFGPNKPPSPYDDFLLATVTDLDVWWTELYPEIYGEAWVPLRGDVYAAYPGRPDDLPGCGTPRTGYPEVQEFVAFYCGTGDFIVYDDGDDGLLAALAENFGAGTIGIVLAHEYGHAIQQRSGVLERRLPTVVSEQQADCFAGAWAARAARGEGGLTFTDADVRSGLIAMLEVRDPVGIDQFTPGGHGSGFDRVGAFQVGFQRGPQRCSELDDDPLPLMPNQFNDSEDFANEGNAPFGYGERELLGFLVNDLNLFWANDAAIDGFEPLTLTPVQAADGVPCTDLEPGFDAGVALCPSTDTVYLNEPAALDLYRQPTFGDFSIGYLIGIAWADDVQTALGSTLDGEARELANDCLTGAWVQTVIPVDFALPEPRDPDRTAVVSPGDLDEAVRTAILIGDVAADDDVLGSSFEKIDAFRRGVIGGLDACDV
ncbi:MAG: hypothetical protein HKN44_01215 [Ilumatobacter sp.]|nr:hypothetical protein [Ilumatobacter sp.]